MTTLCLITQCTCGIKLDNASISDTIMFQHTSLLNVVLSAVLTVVVGTEYYSGYPSVANKHFYEYGSQTNDTIDDDVDDIEVQVTLTHSAVLFGVPYTEFSVSDM